MNLKKLIAMTLLPLVLPGAAMATQASFTVSGVTVNLIDLDATDGVTPAITFLNEYGGASYTVQHQPGNQYSWDYTAMGTVTHSSQWAFAEATKGPMSLSVAAQVLQPNTSAEVRASWGSSFTLSKNTLAIFSLPYTVSLTKSSANYLSTSFNFSGYVPGSSFDTDYTFRRGQVNSTLFGEIYTGSSAAQGYFDMGATLFASDAPPIPEPGTYAMLLAGLGVVGWRLRQRNATAA